MVTGMTMTFEPTLELLKPVVRRLLDDPSATPETFAIKALKPGLGNPTSLGVYRVSGVARSGSGEAVNFSLVVKHLANGLPLMDTSAPTNWNHYRREIEFFESPVAARIPASIAYPRYLGQSDLADGSCLFWNGDLGDLEKSQWTWDQCLNAARLVAELNSIDNSDFDKYDWLCRNIVSGWAEFNPGFFDPIYPKYVAAAQATPERAAAFEIYGPFMNRHDLIGSIVEGGRRCFVHGDYNLNNLVAVVNGATSLIALDWQLCGVGRVGMEVAAIYNTANELGVIKNSAELFDEICRVYAERFNELNPSEPVTLNEVRLAAAAQGYFILLGVSVFLGAPEPDKTDAENAAKVEGQVDYFSTGPFIEYAAVLHELL